MEQEKVKQLILPLFSKPYIKLTSIATKLGKSPAEIENYVEIAENQVTRLGLKLEILELNNDDYIVLYHPNEESELSNLKLGLLCVIAHLCKLRGGYLTENMKQFLDQSYKLEMQFFETRFYLEKASSGLWFLSPLGFLTVFPVLDKTTTLVNSII